MNFFTGTQKYIFQRFATLKGGLVNFFFFNGTQKYIISKICNFNGWAGEFFFTARINIYFKDLQL